MTGHLKLMPLLATPSLLLGELQVLGSTNSATIPTVPRAACSPLWGLLANNRVAGKKRETILVVTVRVPVWWGQNADLRLRSIFPFLFLKTAFHFTYAGAQPPPNVQAAVGEHLHVPRGVQFTP